MDASYDTGAVYDAFDYPATLQANMSPDRLRAAGLMYGWRSRPPEEASILEIGCSDGINMIATAAAYPSARCVGFDLSAVAIARGQSLIDRVGLENVELMQGDILTYPRDGEKFDYIVAHGVLTWIPLHVRAAMFELIAARLAPGGVVYLGYDSLPGCAVKQEIANFILPSILHIEDLDRRVDAFVSIAAVLAANQAKKSHLAVELAAILGRRETHSKHYFYHDYLEPNYAPISIRDLAQQAEAVGLRFAGDATMQDLFAGDIDSEGRQMVAAAGTNLLERSTRLSFLRGARMFRADMLVRADAPPEAEPDSIQFLTFTYLGQRTPAETAKGPGIRYELRQGTHADVVDPLAQRVMDALFESAPREMTLSEIAAAAGSDVDSILGLLVSGATMGLIESHSSPQNFTLKPGPFPEVSGLSRALLAASTTEPIVSLRHSHTLPDDPGMRFMLSLCDGNHSRAEIAALMTEKLGIEVTLEELHKALLHAAKSRLFTA